MVYLIAAGAFIIWLAIAWFAGSLMHLTGASLWVLRGSLALLGLACDAVLLWYYLRQRKPTEAEEGMGPGADEIDLLFRNAGAKLHQAGGLGRLPAILIAGESGSTKTSVVVNSGLEPELLAGQVYREDAVVPTRTANIWYASGTAFIEAGGSLLKDPEKWARLARYLRPGRLRSVVGQRGQAPRAALLCFDIESFLKPGGAEAAAAQARSLRARLGEISERLGIQLPVYAVFTRLDRMPFFAEYVRNLSGEEATQVLGATLPLRASSAAGLYGEQEGGRIGAAFDELFKSLADARLEFLGRENDPASLPAVYEFPREFRKLKTVLTGFMVDLCRPSQLATGPFLRGFYFTGVRPVIVNEPGRAAATAPERTIAEAGATSMFRAGLARQAQPAPAAPARGARKVPQWVFLGHLFRDVVLADRAALGASGHSTRAGLWRMALLATAGAAGLFLIVAFTISWSRNRALEDQAVRAALGITAAESTGFNLPSADALRQLETLRQSVETLGTYRRDGVPLSMRWALYTGNELYPRVRRVYFEKFRQLLFAQTQGRLLEFLRSLPGSPAPDYSSTYDTLKAYLITSSNHDKSTRLFLGPVLLDRWSAGRNVDPERLQLARKQYEFYAEELKQENPFSSENDTLAVTKGRGYLAQFGGMERVYAATLADAAKSSPPVNFNRKFPGSSEVVVDNREVAGAFTKGGWEFMKNAIGHPERYFAGEQWVLGDQATGHFDVAKLRQELRERYNADFVKEWRAYMKAAAVVRYASLPDAAKKLNILAGNQSPLLALFALASQNTAVDDPAVSGAFQPVQAVVPAGTVDRFIAPPNQSYMGALLSLQASLEQIANQPGGDTKEEAAGPVLANATSAKVITRQLAQGFRPDPDAHVDAAVEKLMEDPITQVEGLLRVLGPAELNAKGKGLCGQMRPLWSKYPFNPGATAQASVAEVNAAFRRPDGAMWSFYEANLQKLLLRQGSQYVANPGASVHVGPEFLSFFNQAAAISDALYGGNAQDPHFAYTMKGVPAEGMSIGLEIDGQTLSYGGGAPVAKQFVWQGSTAHEAKASVKFGGGPDLVWSNDQGTWAAFHFFDKADRWQAAEAGYNVEWTIRIGKDKDPVTLPNGKPLTMRFDIDTGGMAPVLQRGYMGRAACVAEVAH